VTLLVEPLAASAQPPAVHVGLHYEVEGTISGCPSAAELQAKIVAQLGYDPFESPGSGSQQVRVEIGHLGAGAEARIQWLDESGAIQGERRLSSPDKDCAELATGVAFATAVQIQLSAASIAPPPAPPPAPAPRPPPPPPPRRAVTAAGRSWLVGAGALARFGRQPGVAPGVRTFASLGGRAWAVQVDAHATLPTANIGASGAGFSARELGLGAAPCLRRGAVDACALGALTLLSVQGEGVDQPKSPSAVGFGVGVRLQVTLPWRDRLAAVIHADLLAQLAPREVLLNRESVWSTAPVAAAVGLDLAAIFR
jgi:hypothetical protein